MKKFYILFLFLSPIALMAQDFVYEVGQTADMELDPNTYTAADIFVKTPDESGITFEWSLVENTLPEGWDYSLCDYTGCYPGVPESGIMTPISDDQMAAGTKGFFKLSINPFEIGGEGHVILYVYDSENEEVGDTVTFNVNFESTASISEEVAVLSIYPNPASNFVTIDFGTQDIEQVTLKDISGQAVYANSTVSKSKLKVDVSNLPAGIYFVTIGSVQYGEIVRKIIVR